MRQAKTERNQLEGKAKQKALEGPIPKKENSEKKRKLVDFSTSDIITKVSQKKRLVKALSVGIEPTQPAGKEKIKGWKGWSLVAREEIQLKEEEKGGIQESEASATSKVCKSKRKTQE
ncbi:hypothetical protein DFH28DRAFT_1109044 [Melampsora americana]|nr:hypothetical protein DFH28DRAFT_1109044 [Melampsora americana]